MRETKIGINASFNKKIKSVEDKVDMFLKDQLTDIARTAVDLSPVDTGAYVTSFSYTVGAGRPRGKSSANKPKYQNKQSKRDEGFSNLMQDLSRAKDLEGVSEVELRNRSPHADDVENGTNWSKTQGYFVFAQIRNIYG